MRLKQFITEGRSKELKEDEVIDLIKKNCKQALNKYKKGIVIYRGVEMDVSYAFVDPKKSKPRRSANTSNYYTLINDNSPYWKQYPKRSESLICTTNKFTPEGYGTSYIVLPYDNAKIGVCSESDYWDSFPVLLEQAYGHYSYYNLASFNRDLERLFEQVDIPLSDNSYSSLQHSFGLFDITFDHDVDSIDSLKNDDGFYFLKWYEEVWDLMKHFNDILEPKSNKFGLYKINNLNKYNDREVWTDSKAVLVNTHNNRYILDEL
jgi:hypothetical protein